MIVPLATGQQIDYPYYGYYYGADVDSRRFVHEQPQEQVAHENQYADCTEHKKNNRYDGFYREYDPETGELIYEATYQFGRLNGKAKSLVRDNRFDYWEISTYVNGRQTGPFESRYVKNDKVREIGTYRNGHRTGRWKRYDINGKLEMEWEE